MRFCAALAAIVLATVPLGATSLSVNFHPHPKPLLLDICVWRLP